MDWEKTSVITAAIGLLIAIFGLIRDIFDFKLSWIGSKSRISKFAASKQVQIVLIVTFLLGSCGILYRQNQELQATAVAQAIEIAAARSTFTALSEENERLKATRTPLPSNDSFDYQVLIQDVNTKKPITSAKVTLRTGNGLAPVDEITDSTGFARLRVDETLSGRPGLLRVDAEGYSFYEKNIDISKGSLPDVVEMEPIILSTPLSPVADEHLFAQDGFSKVSFRWHIQPRTENEKYGYVHLNVCFTTPYFWLRTMEVTPTNTILYDEQGIEPKSRNEPCQPDLVPVRDLDPKTIIHVILAATQEKDPMQVTGHVYQIRVKDDLSDIEIKQLADIELQKSNES